MTEFISTTSSIETLTELNSVQRQVYSRQNNQQTLNEKEQISIFHMKTLIVCICPNFSETIKNLLRNGQKDIYIYDDTIVEEKDIKKNYFFEESDIGKRKDESAKRHNPTLIILNKNELNINNLKQFGLNSIVVADFIDFKQIENLNRIANELSIPFIFSCQMGLSFFIFSDFGQMSSQDIQKIQHQPMMTYFSSSTTEQQINNLSTYNDEKLKTFVFLYSIIQYQQKFSSFPRLFSDLDSNNFYSLLQEVAQTYNIDFSEQKESYLRFTKTSRTQIPLVAEISGALTACEILKCVVKRFSPLNQVLFWDNFKLYPFLKQLSLSHISSINPAYFDYISLFGEENMNKIANMNILVVGCGAVGCEQIKNLYQMGAGTGSKGQLHISDDDYIDISNLPRQSINLSILIKNIPNSIILQLRQVLFTDEDTKQSKALSCKKWLQRKDPKIRVTSYENLVCSENENIYNQEFFSNLDMIVIAVDTMKARLYLAEKAQQHNIFLIESATNGFIAQSQCQVPFFSEKIDVPLEQQQVSTASCTTKRVLKTVGDCLIYAKTVSKEFTSLRESNGSFLKDKDIHNIFSLYYKFQDNIGFCDQVLKLFVEDIFNQIFYDDILSKGDTHNQFKFDKKNPDHTEFVDCLFNILKKSFTQYNLYETIDFVQYQSTSKKTSTNKNQQISKILPLFDKDDQVHGNFVYQLSKLRAKAFNIPFNLERYDAIGKIGNIIPAIIESTSVASGFALLQLFNWIQHKDDIIDLYENMLKLNQEAKEAAYSGQEKETQQDSTIKRLDLFLSKQQIKDLEMKFNQFGFKDTDALVRAPNSLNCSNSRFKIVNLSKYEITVDKLTPLQQIVHKIIIILNENKLPSPYMIDFKQNTIYKEDYSNINIIELKNIMESYLKMNFLQIVKSTKQIADCNYDLVAYESSQLKLKGIKLAEIKLIIL